VCFHLIVLSFSAIKRLVCLLATSVKRYCMLLNCIVFIVFLLLVLPYGVIIIIKNNSTQLNIVEQTPFDIRYFKRFTIT